MSANDRKTEPPFGLDMDFGEALERFLRTSPRELEDSVERSKQKKTAGSRSSTAASAGQARKSVL